MKKMISILMVIVMLLAFTGMLTAGVYAETEEVQAVAAETEEANENDVLTSKAWAAAIAVAVVGAAGAVSMAIAIAKSAEGMARQPEAAGKINSAMMLGLVFIETAIIYALIIAILVIFVL